MREYDVTVISHSDSGNVRLIGRTHVKAGSERQAKEEAITRLWQEGMGCAACAPEALIH